MGGEWIEWPGGECPVEPGTKTQIRLRDGREIITERPAHLAWGRFPHGSMIIAYRVVHS